MGALSDGTRNARAAQEEAPILARSYLPLTDIGPILAAGAKREHARVHRRLERRGPLGLTVLKTRERLGFLKERFLRNSHPEIQSLTGGWWRRC